MKNGVLVASSAPSRVWKFGISVTPRARKVVEIGCLGPGYRPPERNNDREALGLGLPLAVK